MSRTQQVAIKGFENSYHDIVRKFLVPDSTFLGFADFHNTVRAVRDGSAQKGIIAVYNSIYGSTPAYVDLRRNFDGMVATQEMYLSISHRLLGAADAQEITEIRSDPIALRQCAETISKLYPNAKLVESDDTAKSAYEVADLIREGETRIAAIAGAAAGEAREELVELHSAMQDDSPNRTRFVLFRPIANGKRAEDYIPVDANKTSTILTIPNHQASLVQVLQIFSEQGIDFTYVDASSDRIDSLNDVIVIPFDFAASWNAEHTKKAIMQLRLLGVSVRLIGSYEAGDVKEV